MKNAVRKVIAFSIVIVILLSLNTFAFAAVDVNVKTSLEIHMVIGNSARPNADLALYKVGDGTPVAPPADGLTYSLTGAFTASGVELNGLTASQTMSAARTLGSYATGTPDATGTTGADGKVLFTDLEVGVYLVVLTSTGGENYTMNPFLVYFPHLVDGEWYYAIKATPKVSVPPPYIPGTESEPPVDIPETDPPLDPGETPPPGTTEPPEPPVIEIPDDDPPLAALPQTGVLQWPIPVLAFAGIQLFCIGWIVNDKKKKAINEK